MQKPVLATRLWNSGVPILFVTHFCNLEIQIIGFLISFNYFTNIMALVNKSQPRSPGISLVVGVGAFRPTPTTSYPSLMTLSLGNYYPSHGCGVTLA